MQKNLRLIFMAVKKLLSQHLATLTLRKKLHTRQDQAYIKLIVSGAMPHAHAAREWGVMPCHAKVETPTKKLA